MKRLGKDYEKLETLNLLSLFPEDHDIDVRDPKRRSSFLSQIDSGLGRALASESTLHGIRTQTMFQLMIASFGAVRLIKQEDSGECYYTSDEPIQLPDYKVVLEDGQCILVETKNHYKTDPLAGFRMREADLNALARCSNLLQSSLKIAIYWAPWNTWTLNDPAAFSRDGKYSRLDFVEAVTSSEMACLGDFSVGTKCPLTLRLSIATDKPRSIDSAGCVTGHLSALEFYCAGQLIEEELEKQIALYLMMYGKWKDNGPGAEVDSDHLPTAILYQFEPQETHPGQGFEIIGSLSSMFSTFYNSVTLEQSRVRNLVRYDNPGAFGSSIPRGFKGKSLPLWRFIQQPAKPTGSAG